VLLALALFAPGLLLSVVSADASPVRKAHVRQHRAATRRVMTPGHPFEGSWAEQATYRHPRKWFEKRRHAAETTDHDAAIQNSSSPASAEAPHEAPELRPLELVVLVQAQISSHEGFAPSSPRAPPAFS
jgi:hypothetical protein